MPPKRQFSGGGGGGYSKFSKKPFKRSYSKDEDEDASSKRFKSTSTAKAPDGMKHTDEEGNAFWELDGRSRRVTVSEFKGSTYIGIREYYEKDGKQLPGKKGISLNLDQFNQLIRVLPALEEAIGQKTSSGVVRPIYTSSAKHAAPKVKEEEPEEESEEEDEKPGKGEKEEEEYHEEDESEEEKPKKKKLEAKATSTKADKTGPTRKQKVPDSDEEEEEENESEEE